MNVALRRGFAGSCLRRRGQALPGTQDIRRIGCKLRAAGQWGDGKSPGRFSNNRPRSKQLRNARTVCGETQADRPRAIQLKLMCGFTDDASRDRAKMLARCPYDSLLAQ